MASQQRADQQGADQQGAEQQHPASSGSTQQAHQQQAQLVFVRLAEPRRLNSHNCESGAVVAICCQALLAQLSR